MNLRVPFPGRPDTLRPLTSRAHWEAGRPEVWLDLDQAAVTKLLARLGPAAAEHRESAFYDTADLLLRRAGVRLEIVRHGRRGVQCVTLPPALHRRECLVHETDLADRMPDRAHLLTVLPPAVAAALDERPLERLFALRYTRTTAREPNHTPALEVVLDRGVLAVAGIETAFAELMTGDVGGGDAARAATALLDGLPVRLATEDRWERGFRIAAGVQVRPQRNRPVWVEAGATVGDAGQMVLRNAFEHFLRNLPAASLYGDVEAVHQMRVGLRRLRAFTSVFRGTVGDPFRAELEELQQLFAALAEVRECDVFLESTLPLIRPQQLQASERAAFEVTARLHRASALGALRRVFDGPDLARVVSALALRLQGDGWRDRTPRADLLAHVGAATFAARRIRTLHRKLVHARPERSDELDGWHRARVRAKKVRYALEPLRSVYPRPASRLKPYAKALETLQEGLGLLNDLRTAADVVVRLVPEGERNAAVRAVAAALAEHHDACVGKLLRRAARALSQAEEAFPSPRQKVRAVAVVGRDHEAAHVARSLAAAWGCAGVKVGIEGAGDVACKKVLRLKRQAGRTPPRSLQRLLRVSAKRPARDADLVLLTARDHAAQGLVVLVGPALPGEAPASFRVPAPEMASHEAFAGHTEAALAVQASWQPLLFALEARLRD